MVSTRTVGSLGPPYRVWCHGPPELAWYAIRVRGWTPLDPWYPSPWDRIHVPLERELCRSMPTLPQVLHLPRDIVHDDALPVLLVARVRVRVRVHPPLVLLDLCWLSLHGLSTLGTCRHVGPALHMPSATSRLSGTTTEVALCLPKEGKLLEQTISPTCVLACRELRFGWWCCYSTLWGLHFRGVGRDISLRGSNSGLFGSLQCTFAGFLLHLSSVYPY
jgi:hypothetical protein